MVIAWVCVHGRGRQCNHRPVRCQVAELTKLFGPDIQIQFHPMVSLDPKFIPHLRQHLKASEVVLVGPLTLIDEVTRLGQPVLQCLTKDVPAHEGDWIVSGVGKKFLGFRRVDSVSVNGQDL